MRLNRPDHLRHRPVIGRAFNRPATLLRETGGRRDPDNARWIPGGIEEIDITLSAAPVAEDNAQVRDSLPAGMRNAEAMRFWLTGSEVSTLKSGDGQTTGDRIRYPAAGDAVYRVVALSVWDDITSCVAIRVTDV